MLELLSTTLQQFSNPINIFLSILLSYRVYKLLPSFRFSELQVESPDGRNFSSESTATATTGSVDSISLSESTIEYHERPSKFPETLVWRTYTPLELQHFDGKNGTRIRFAVNRVVYDVTSGRNYYGPDGPYGNFAGRDASRGLAKQSFEDDMLTAAESRIDRLEDLTDEDRDRLRGWEDLFKSKYIPCGELIENSERAKKPI
ncbi:hypothetical protein PCASD_23351 [Puccinia coronata f. sp. avenae]|uniref:Cytochrome b5 heme-binding domain-containing protein n=1 Tax=Puccinia coronata f. sp. avenae TaxID=200324 RepID=A0A2N5S704_9BASI|nr:hypothetical protein PCASD_23351 [Puccinia coronata f. sp. avenae]